MSDLSAFLNLDHTKSIAGIEKKVVISKRIKDENGKPIKWIIKASTEEKRQALDKKYTTTKLVGGTVAEILNQRDYQAEMIVESVVYPDLRNAELCRKYGVNDPLLLAKTMLLPGEYLRLAHEVMEINGYYENYDAEDYEVAKNS